MGHIHYRGRRLAYPDMERSRADSCMSTAVSVRLELGHNVILQLRWELVSSSSNLALTGSEISLILVQSLAHLI